MPPIAITILYLISEALNQGIKLSDMLAQADATGALPPETVAAIRKGLKSDFAEAKEFWGA